MKSNFTGTGSKGEVKFMANNIFGLTALLPNQAEVFSLLNSFKEAHTFYSFMYIQARQFRSNNCSSIMLGLQELPDELGNIFGKYYGNTVGNHISKSMARHYDLFTDYVNSFCNENQITEKLYSAILEDSDKFAEFLVSLNPYWKEMELRAMLSQEIKILSTLIKNNSMANYDSVIFYYSIYAQIISDISAYISIGIIRQFSI